MFSSARCFYCAKPAFQLIRNMMNEQVDGIGIGVPSIVDPEKGIVYNVANISSWKEIHLKEILENEFKVAVAINNDSNCFTLGESYTAKENLIPTW